MPGSIKPLKQDLKTEVEKVLKEVDKFRGIPGFYWAVWSLVQATISTIEQDYVPYSHLILAVFWAWREEEDGTRLREGTEKGLREQKWGEE